MRRCRPGKVYRNLKPEKANKKELNTFLAPSESLGQLDSPYMAALNCWEADLTSPKEEVRNMQWDVYILGKDFDVYIYKAAMKQSNNGASVGLHHRKQKQVLVLNCNQLYP